MFVKTYSILNFLARWPFRVGANRIRKAAAWSHNSAAIDLLMGRMAAADNAKAGQSNGYSGFNSLAAPSVLPDC